MKKTYVTTMPDDVGAFLRASRCISALGINITRVSYDKAVDLHTLFIEVDADEDALHTADEQLSALGYTNCPAAQRGIVMMEFKLRDQPGSVIPLLELIARNDLNISYISSHEDGSGYQSFRMGLLTDSAAPLDEFLHEANLICPARVLDLKQPGRSYDNSVFYASFVGGLARCMGLDPGSAGELMINVNSAMQTLDERNLAPQTTFDCISRFAELLARARGAGYNPRITQYDISPDTRITLIEPPCGSNTAVICSRGRYLCVDTGYACYREELLSLLRGLIPGFDPAHCEALITHADVDHCGLVPLFERVYMSERSRQSLMLEHKRLSPFREQNALHAPYIRICKALTSYAPPEPERLEAAFGAQSIAAPLEAAGSFEFGELRFDVFEGAGGHLPGEVVLIDYAHGIAFAGDIFVNLKDMTPEQAEYNRYAPILMTSVDTDRALAASERATLMRRLGAGQWLIFGGHGRALRYCVTGERRKEDEHGTA